MAFVRATISDVSLPEEMDSVQRINTEADIEQQFASCLEDDDRFAGAEVTVDLTLNSEIGN